MKFLIVSVLFITSLSSCMKGDEKLDTVNEYLQKNEIQFENDSGDSKIYLVGDGGCFICYKNLQTIFKEDSSAYLIYYSSDKRIKYDRTIFKNYLPKERIQIIYDSELLDHISENYGFIKSYVEFQRKNKKVIELIVHN